MLDLSAGLRQSLSIFLQPLTRDIGISVAEFALPIAVQNLSWELLQPLASGLAMRWGFRAIMVRGAVAISRGAC